MATVEKRGENTYRVSVFVGRDINGKKLRKTCTFVLDNTLKGKKLDHEIDRIVLEFENKVLNGEFLDGHGITLQDFSKKWIEAYGKNLAPKTILSYKDLLSDKILPAIGHIKMDRLQPKNIIDLYEALSKPGIRKDFKYTAKQELIELINKTGISKLGQLCNLNEKTISNLRKGLNTNQQIVKAISEYFAVKPSTLFIKNENDDGRLSGNTLNHIHRCLSSMLSTAVEWQVITSNPCDRVPVPKIKKKEANIYDEDLIEKVLEQVDKEDDLRLKTIIYLAIFTGMRLGEMSGLQWNDVDMDKNLISIKRASQYVGDKSLPKEERTILKDPKNETSKRTISVPEMVINVLRLYKAFQNKQKLFIGDGWQAKEKLLYGQEYDNNRILKSYDGCAVHPDYPSKAFKKFREKYNLPPLTFHQLRHSCASLLIGEGIDVATVSKRLGHSNPGTTTKIYAYALRRPDQEASNKLESMFIKKRITKTEQA